MLRLYCREEMEPYYNKDIGAFCFDDYNIQIWFDLETGANIKARTIEAVYDITAHSIFARAIYGHNIHAHQLFAREVRATRDVRASFYRCKTICCDSFSNRFYGRHSPDLEGTFLEPYTNICGESGEEQGVISSCGKGVRWFLHSGSYRRMHTCGSAHYSKDKMDRCPLCGCVIR